jgi:hypothetical protein
MAEQREGDPVVGTRVRLKSDGRTYVITQAYEEGGREVYDGMLARVTSDLAEHISGFVGLTADAFDVLP